MSYPQMNRESNMQFVSNHLRYVATVFAMLLTIFPIMPTQAQSPASQEALEKMFANITKNTKWKMSGDMLWGYFFTHSTRAPLEAAAKELSKMGYRVVDIYLSNKDKPSDPDLWWLHVERVEIHSVSSLHKRNIELAAFAKQRHLDSYDGMDVGPVNGINK
jgi:hypothetical protein